MNNVGRAMLLVAVAVLGSGLASPQPAQAHCQIPCGIYDDHARVQGMLEDVATVEKSARLIGELTGKSDAQSQNQLVRWVMNKEAHAQAVILTVCDYFLTQRVKPSQDDYAERLVKHHAVIVAAMKAKQKHRLGILRMLQAAVKQVEVDQRKDLEDADVQKIIVSYARKVKDQIQGARDSGREDLLDQAEQELVVVTEYLPAEMDDAALELLVREAIAETGADGPRDMGNVMMDLLVVVSLEARRSWGPSGSL